MGGLGLLGGCFNPVHNGHLRLAVEVREALGLDRVDLVPAHVPPHKSDAGMLPFELRAALAEAAVGDAPGLAVNRIEAQREGPSYTVDTLRALRERHPGLELWFVLGAGDLFALPQWHEGTQVPRLANLAVAGRGGDGPEDVERFVAGQWPDALREEGGWRLPFGTSLRLVPLERLDISSSDVRRRWMAGRSVLGLVPRAVESALRGQADAVDAAWAGDA